MESLREKLNNGLTAYQIKIIALVIMTVDHIGAFAFPIPAVYAHYTDIRIIGRIAAPLFLLMVAEGAKYTRSKTRFALRLYLAGVGVGLFTAVTNFLFRDSVGIFSPGNILFTFFYTVLYILLLEGIRSSIKQRRKLRLLCYLAAVAATAIPYFLFLWTYGAGTWIPRQLKPEYVMLLHDLFDSFFISPLTVDYSPFFILLGISFYYCKSQISRGAVFAAFCVICFAGAELRPLGDLWPFNEFFGFPQYFMVMALPFIWLYNGKRGRAHKLFFYIYYPLHRYFINIIVYLLHY